MGAYVLSVSRPFFSIFVCMVMAEKGLVDLSFHKPFCSKDSNILGVDDKHNEEDLFLSLSIYICI